MKVLLTGIAGFIGSHVAERLMGREDEVVGLDNFDPFYDRAIKERNFAPLKSKGCQLIEGDVLDRPLLDRVLSEGAFDCVIHLAALAGVRPSIQSPWRYQKVNVEGSCHLAQAMVEHGPKRLVFASSSSVYGDNSEVPFSEDHRVDLPASPYASSKRAGELLLRTFHQIHGLESACLRFFTVYGPRQRPEMAIHKFCRLVESGKPITMFGDGSTSRDYTYIDDIVTGVVGAVDHCRGHRIYNLGNTHPCRLDELIQAIGKAVGKEPRIEQAPLQAGDVMRTWADVSQARRDLGYEPKILLEEGLSRFVDWMRAQEPTG